MLRFNTDTILAIIAYLLDKLAKEAEDLQTTIDKHYENAAIAQAKAADAESTKARAEALRTKLGKIFE